MMWQDTLNQLDDYCWEIPQSYKEGMRVPGRIFASKAMLDHIFQEQVFQQVANVAFLPGIVGQSLAMPDVHWGYGFPIGGVAATRVSDGHVSPGGRAIWRASHLSTLERSQLDETQFSRRVGRHTQQ